MPSPLPFPPKLLVAIALVAALVGCQPTSPRPVPSVPQIGGNLKCAQGDHGYEDLQAGWSFCYPGTWKYIQRAQAIPSPSGLDLAFDITNVPCTTPPTGQPVCSSDAGLFAVMIISTYERDSSADLANWVDLNLKPAPERQTISWGNAVEAVKLTDGRRVALTPHHVVIMDLHSGPLNLEKEMSSRLGTWKFSL
jgi:hypothetical protein